MAQVRYAGFGERKRLSRYAVAVIAAGAGILLRLALDPFLQEQAPLLVLIMSVVVSAWYGGLGPGLVATAICTVGGTFLFVEPRFTFRIVEPSEAVRICIFVVEGTLISMLIAVLHSTRQRLESGTQKLAESEERFRLLVDSVKDCAIFLLTPSGHVSSWNDGAERITGYEADTIIGQHFEIFYPAGDGQRTTLTEQLAKVQAAERVVDQGWRVRKDGSRFWADVVVSAVRDHQDQLRGFAMVVRDITEQREAEAERQRLYGAAEAARVRAEAMAEQLRRVQAVSDAALAHLALDELLQELLARIRTALNADTATILLLDPSRNTLVVRAAQGLEEEVTGQIHVPVGQGFAGRIAVEGRPLQINDLASAEIVSPILRSAGLQSLLGAPLVIEGHVIGVVHVGTRQSREFTADDMLLLQLVADRAALAIDHARVFEAQREAVQRLETLHAIDRAILAAQSIKAVTAVALSHMRALVPYQQALVLVEKSPSAAEVFPEPADYSGPTHLDRDAFLALSAQQLIQPDLLPADEAQMGSAQRAALQALLAPGTRSVLAQPLRTKDRLVGSLVLMAPEVGVFRKQHQRIAREVSDQLAIALQQAQLRKRVGQYAVELERRVAQRTRQLADANAELEAYAYVVAHDLRAPLRAVRGFAQILQEDYFAVLDARGQQYAERINHVATQMDTLIQDLLAYSRLSRAYLALQPTELTQVVAEACAQLELEIQERNAQVTVEPGLPAVIGHLPTLVQIVANLLGNALKFVPAGQQSLVRIWGERRNATARLWIEDNGIGIAPHHHERIFQVFERLHGVEAYAGSGIGLAIVRKGMERMGGQAGVESNTGQGSRFWIELPAPEEVG